MSKRKFRCPICQTSGPSSKFINGFCDECNAEADNKYSLFTLDDTVEMVRSMKEERVTTANEPNIDPGGSDLPTMLMFWRGIRPVCVLAIRPDPDLCLKVASACIPSLSADGCILVQEAFGRTADALGHPDGRDWESGEFQRMFESGRGEEFGIKESLNIIRFTRRSNGVGCTNKSRSLMFSIVEGEVSWIDRSEEPLSLGGPIPRAINRFFEEQCVDMDRVQKELALQPDAEFGPDEYIPYRRLHTDLGVLQSLYYVYKGDVIVGYFANAEDPEEVEIVTYAMEQMGQDDTWLTRAIQKMTN